MEKMYMLRSSAHYLSDVSEDGLKAVFDFNPARALKFNILQRCDFAKEHPHIKGRWVLHAAELKRLGAA